MRALRQHVNASRARETLPGERAIEPREVRRGERRMAAFEEHESRARRGGEHAREQDIVVRMDLEQRLRAQEQRRVFGQAERARARIGRARRARA